MSPITNNILINVDYPKGRDYEPQVETVPHMIQIGTLTDDKPGIFDQVMSPIKLNLKETDGLLPPPKLYNNTDLHEDSHPSINVTEHYESHNILGPVSTGYIGNSHNSVQKQIKFISPTFQNSEEVQNLIKATAKMHERNITPMKL